MLTLFTTCKPFRRKTDTIIQTNALSSWGFLEPRPEIILFGDEKYEKGITELSERLGYRLIGDLVRNQWDTPLLGDIMLRAQKVAKHDILCRTNADLIFFQDFMEAVKIVSREFRQFLLIGAKWQLEGPMGRLDFSGDWRKEVLDLARRTGHRHPRSGSDYHVFTRGLFRGRKFRGLEDRPKMHTHPDFPIEFVPLAWGPIRFDTWLVWQSLRREIPVIDATEMIFAVHQDHRYQGAGMPRIAQQDGSEQVKLNERFSERARSGGGRISNATWVLDKKGLRKK